MSDPAATYQQAIDDYKSAAEKHKRNTWLIICVALVALLFEKRR